MDTAKPLVTEYTQKGPEEGGRTEKSSVVPEMLDKLDSPSVLAISNLRCPSPPPILQHKRVFQEQSEATSNVGSPDDINPSVNGRGNVAESHTNEYHPADNNEAMSRGTESEFDNVKTEKRRNISNNNVANGPTHGHYGQPSIGKVLENVVQYNGTAAAHAVTAAMAAQTARDKLSTSNMSMLKSSLEKLAMDNEQKEATLNAAANLRASSIHAHFYLDDTLKHPATNNRSRSGSGSRHIDSVGLKAPYDNFSGLMVQAGASNNASSNAIIGSNQNLPGNSIYNIESRSNSNSGITVQIPHAPTATFSHPGSGGITGNPIVSNGISNNGGFTGVNMGISSTTNTNMSSGVLTPQSVFARLQHDDGKLHILFGACGSVSIKKTRLIINKLDEIYGDKVSVQIILTKSAENFISNTEFPASVNIWRDEDEWTSWNSRTDPVLHIELRKWADILIIAPLTANTLSKIALGLCDNLLTNVVRAWNSQYPIMLAPAMVSFAYTSVITKRHVKVIKEHMPWIEILKPTEKVMSSYGEIGMGGMMDWNEIVVMIVEKLGGYPDDDEDEDDEDDNGDATNENNGDDDDEDDDEDDDDDDDDDAENDVAAGCTDNAHVGGIAEPSITNTETSEVLPPFAPENA